MVHERIEYEFTGIMLVSLSCKNHLAKSSSMVAQCGQIKLITGFIEQETLSRDTDINVLISIALKECRHLLLKSSSTLNTLVNSSGGTQV